MNSMDIIIPKDCGNAPKKQILIQFTLAVWNKKMDVIQQYAHESIEWHQLKIKKTSGLHEFMEAIQAGSTKTIERLEVFHVITHGKWASMNGVITYEDKSIVDFCDVYTFNNHSKSAKIIEVKSYQV